MIDFDFNTPISYAKAIAYLPDPSTIRARVVQQFGAKRAPSLDQCRNLRAAYLESRKNSQGRCQERFGRNFKCSHPQTEENTIISINGIDTCKTCAALKRDVKQAERNRAEYIMRALREKQAKLDKARKQYEQAVAENAEPSRPLFPREVVAHVARLFMMEPSDLLGGVKRHSRYIDARATAAKILHNRGLSYPHIGRIMKRDHSTIINLLSKLDRYKARNPMIDHVLGIIT